MLQSQPLLAALIAAGAAAAMAPLGALRPRSSSGDGASVGYALAIASGLMLGLGYALISRALAEQAVAAVLGAGLGVFQTWMAQVYAGTAELDLDPDAERQPGYGYKLLLQNVLHAASEGIAIGAALVAELRLGIFMAVALAFHNIAESMGLADLLRRQGVGMPRAAGLCFAAKTPQILFAVAVLALGPWLRRWQPILTGFAAGSLLFLVMTELLPASYRRSGQSTVAAIVSLSAGLVVLVEAFVV